MSFNKDKNKVENVVQKTEEFAIVLDYMPSGKSSATKSEPIAQVIGKDFFTLLEVTPKIGKSFSFGEEVFIGKDNRDKVDLIKGRIYFKDLTSNSLSELNDIIEDIVVADEKRFLDFFNTARAISLTRHQIELLPGFGKKHMVAVLDEREKKRFDSFDEIVQRIKNVPDPRKAIVKRIVEEIEGPEDKHYVFVRVPAAPKPSFFSRQRY